MWNAIYKKLWIVVLVPLVAASIAFFFTYEKAGKYKSVAVIKASIPEEPSKTKTLKDVQEPAQYYENMAATMKTELMTSMVSYRLLLHDLGKTVAFRPPAIQYSETKKEQIQKVLEKKLASFELLSGTVPAEATVAQIIHNMDYDAARWVRDGEMTVEHKPQTNKIEVATSTDDPFLSAFASNALSQEYIRYETFIVGPAPASDSVGYYRQEVDRLRKNMEAKAGELSEISKSKSSPVDDIRFRRLKQNKISEYEMRIVEEEWELNSLREQLAKAERPQANEVQQPATDVASNAKIQAARKKIDQLSSLYVQGGSKDKKLDSIINVLRKQVNDEAVRLQMASQKSAAATPSPNPERDMIRSRIQRHEQAIASLRNDIRKIKNTTNTSGNTVSNESAVAQLTKEQEMATSEYNTALTHLKTLEGKSNSPSTGRVNHHLILKTKALPSAEPESPWAMLIVISAFAGTLAICIIVIAVTKPAPPIPDDIFLRVNYANRQRRLSNKMS